jgi:hypothetical protein
VSASRARVFGPIAFLDGNGFEAGLVDISYTPVASSKLHLILIVFEIHSGSAAPLHPRRSDSATVPISSVKSAWRFTTSTYASDTTAPARAPMIPRPSARGKTKIRAQGLSTTGTGMLWVNRQVCVTAPKALDLPNRKVFFTYAISTRRSPIWNILLQSALSMTLGPVAKDNAVGCCKSAIGEC